MIKKLKILDYVMINGLQYYSNTCVLLNDIIFVDWSDYNLGIEISRYINGINKLSFETVIKETRYKYFI